MNINGINAYIRQVEGLNPTKAKAVVENAGSENFGQMLKSAVSELNQLEKTGNEQIAGLMLGKDGVTPHSAMIALEKADTAFQLFSAVKSKIIRAYEEVMRTQI